MKRPHTPMNIIVTKERFAVGTFRFVAYIDGCEEDTRYYGYGPTGNAAVEDLFDQLDAIHD